MYLFSNIVPKFENVQFLKKFEDSIFWWEFYKYFPFQKMFLFLKFVHKIKKSSRYLKIC